MDHKKYMAELGRKGGRARANKLSKEELSRAAKHAIYSISPEQRILNAKKANRASQRARKMRKLPVHN